MSPPAMILWPLALYFVAVVAAVASAFLFAWAVALRDLGWPGYAEAAIFMAVLLAALFYLWRTGALDWSLGPRPLPGATRPAPGPRGSDGAGSR